TQGSAPLRAAQISAITAATSGALPSRLPAAIQSSKRECPAVGALHTETIASSSASSMEGSSDRPTAPGPAQPTRQERRKRRATIQLRGIAGAYSALVDPQHRS